MEDKPKKKTDRKSSLVIPIARGMYSELRPPKSKLTKLGVKIKKKKAIKSKAIKNMLMIELTNLKACALFFL